MGEENQSSDHVPAGVWVFWMIAILAITGWALSRDKNGAGTVLLIIQIISTVAAAASALAAMQAAKLSYQSLRQTQADRKEELLHKRPYFTFLKGKMGETGDDEDTDFVQAVFKNVGVHPAANITATAVILNDTPYEFTKNILTVNPVNDVPSQFNFEFNRADYFLVRNADQFYVLFTITYMDALINENF